MKAYFFQAARLNRNFIKADMLSDATDMPKYKPVPDAYYAVVTADVAGCSLRSAFDSPSHKAPAESPRQQLHTPPDGKA